MPNTAPSSKLQEALSELFCAPFSSTGDTDVFWIAKINSARNGQLLKGNIFNKSVTKDNADIYLVSAIDGDRDELIGRDAITLSGGIGCLGNVTYCVQSYAHTSNTYNLHNFGTVVMRHRQGGGMVPILFRVHTKRSRIGKMNYLGVGKLIEYIHSQTDILNEEHLINGYDQFHSRIRYQCGGYINNLIYKYRTLQYVNDFELAKKIVEQTAELSRDFNFLSYFYFESVSLALMLNSEDPLSLQLAKGGEFNHLLYIEAVHRYKQNRIGKKFESYGFTPDVTELLDIIKSLTNDDLVRLSEDDFIISVVNNLIFFVGVSITDDESFDGLIFHDFCHLDAVRSSLKPRLDLLSSYYKYEYMKYKSFDLVINSTIEKGEIGICPGAKKSSYVSYVCNYTNNLKKVEIVKEIDVRLGMIEKYHAG